METMNADVKKHLSDVRTIARKIAIVADQVCYMKTIDEARWKSFQRLEAAEKTAEVLRSTTVLSSQRVADEESERVILEQLTCPKITVPSAASRWMNGADRYVNCGRNTLSRGTRSRGVL